MTNRAAAARYARALLDVSVREGDPQQVEQALAGVVDFFRGQPTLEKILLSPAVPVTRKRALMTDLTTRATLTPVVAKLLVLLAERDRLVLLPELLTAYQERLLKHLQIVRAEVTTAVPLPTDRAQALEQRLATVTGQRVSLATRVDPSIIGGVVTRIGSTIYDGSVTRQLERMQEKLAEGA